MHQVCGTGHERYPCHVERGDSGSRLDCRLIGPKLLLEESGDLLRADLPACLEAAYELLGSHPFKRLDILIVPRCYSGLGLASPSLVTLTLKPHPIYFFLKNYTFVST